MKAEASWPETKEGGVQDIPSCVSAYRETTIRSPGNGPPPPKCTPSAAGAVVVTRGVPSLHQVPALRLSYYRRREWQGGSRARPWVAPTSAGGSPPCLPDPQTILETRQDELPPSEREENRPRATQLRSVGWCDPWF